MIKQSKMEPEYTSRKVNAAHWQPPVSSPLYNKYTSWRRQLPHCCSIATMPQMWQRRKTERNSQSLKTLADRRKSTQRLTWYCRLKRSKLARKGLLCNLIFGCNRRFSNTIMHDQLVTLFTNASRAALSREMTPLATSHAKAAKCYRPIYVSTMSFILGSAKLYDLELSAVIFEN
jgi:hypothetical protein